MVTDLHYRLAHYEWLVGRAGDVDIVAVTGDLADVTNSVPIGVRLVVLEQYLDRLAELAVVLIVSGNHDLDGPGSHGEQLANWLHFDQSISERAASSGGSPVWRTESGTRRHCAVIGTFR